MPLPNPELMKKIAELSDGVRSGQEIAELVGKSKSHTQELIRKMNLPRRPKGSGAPRQRSDENNHRVERIKSLADGKKSSKEIALIVGSTAKYVQTILLEFDLPRLPQSGPSGKRNGSFAGGRRIDLDGYVFVSAPKDHPNASLLPGKNIPKILEHRLVMEQKIGRFLTQDEVVDHIDGLHIHNHPDNLRLFASNKDHLQETISGQIPSWSDLGKGKFAIPPRLRKGLKRIDTYRSEKERGDVRLRQILLAWLLLDKASPFLSGSRRWLEKAGIFDFSRPNLLLHLRALHNRCGRGHSLTGSLLNP